MANYDNWDLFEEIGAEAVGALKGLVKAPLGDFLVVAGKQNFWHLVAFINFRPSILRIFKKGDYFFYFF